MSHLVGHLYHSPTLMMRGQTQIKYTVLCRLTNNTFFNTHLIYGTKELIRNQKVLYLPERVKLSHIYGVQTEQTFTYFV
jgi:hypothetical protein